jgi:hypothetical protein
MHDHVTIASPSAESDAAALQALEPTAPLA